MSELTDKELLEAAANVMPFEKTEYQNWAGMDERYGFDEAIWTGNCYWNPLTDDADRLAYARERKVLINFLTKWAASTTGKTFYFDQHGGEARAILLAGLEK